MIKNSELIINEDGSVFHLHACPGEIAETIILVGDPARSDYVASFFDSVELRRANRELVTNTGMYGGKRISVVSTGMGCDNIDIVVTELDALFNVDFETREIKEEKTQLTIVRLGTSGGVRHDIHIGDFAMSTAAVGICGLAYFYVGSDEVRNIELEEKFIEASKPNPDRARPYIVDADSDLVELFAPISKGSLTLSASGFYGPQGRVVRLALDDANYFEGLEKAGVGNIEMEAAAIYLLGKLLGHKTLAVCAIIAQRAEGGSKPNYGAIIEKLVTESLKTLSK
ncbi:MAG: nucleoside phosphorylase [Rikenellaceae bacterium]